MVKQEKLLSYYPFLAHLQEFIFVSRSFPDRPLSSGGSGGETPTYLAFNLVSLKHKCKKLFLSLSQLQTKKTCNYLRNYYCIIYWMLFLIRSANVRFKNLEMCFSVHKWAAKISKKVWICVFRIRWIFF